MTIALRRAVVADAPAIARIMGDPAVYPGLMQLPYTNADLWRARLEDLTVPGKLDLMLVAERETNGRAEIVGSAGLHAVSPLPRRRHVVMLGISVAAEAQGQGVGKALMQGLCGYADRWMQVQRIDLEVYSDNARAIALYRQFGFVREGMRRGFALRDGAYVDSDSMGRLHPNAPVFPAATAVAVPAAAASPIPGPAAAGGWTIRAFDTPDLAAVAALMARRGVAEGLLVTPDAPGEALRERLAKPGSDFALVARADDDKRVIAFAGLTVQPGLRRRHAASLVLFVAPEWQRRGVGSALLSGLLEWADGGAGLLRLELALPDGHAAAQAFCSRFGFERETTQRAAVLRDGAFVDLHLLARRHPRPPRVGTAR